MRLIEALATSEKLESEGIEITFPEAANDDETVPTFIIGSANHIKALKLQQRLFKPYHKVLKRGENEALSNRLWAEVLAKAVVKGWLHVRDANDKDIEFTPEACESLLKQSPKLLRRILNESHDDDNFKEVEESQEEAAKN